MWSENQPKPKTTPIKEKEEIKPPEHSGEYFTEVGKVVVSISEFERELKDARKRLIEPRKNESR